MNKIMRKLWLAFPVLLTAACGYCQDKMQVLREMTQAASGGDGANSGLIGGFSLWGLLGATIFGGIGFIAFIYGKKNSEFRPMALGIALMVYPYFLRETVALYLVGIALTVALKFFRE